MLGNAGSFFKNPLVSAAIVAQIKAQHPDVVAYAQPDGQMKLAALDKHIENIFVITKLSMVFDVYATEEQAIASFAERESV